jgi:hypothetical protein
MKSYVKEEAFFDLNKVTMRELQTFLVVLQYEGESLSDLKKYIDVEFKHKSRTKGYDYINILCQKGFLYKKKVYNKGRETTRIFVNNNIRKQYEKLILPTLSNTKDAYRDFLNIYFDEIKEAEKIREKFSIYTETLKNSIIRILKSSPIKEKESKSLQKKMLGEFENSLKVELIKYQLFSK